MTGERSRIIRSFKGTIDLLEGRAPGTRGDRLAQQYIASQFQALGRYWAGGAPKPRLKMEGENPYIATMRWYNVNH